MIFKQAENEIQIGAKRGPIHDALVERGRLGLDFSGLGIGGLDHEKYNIPEGVLPPYFVGTEHNGERIIGRGSERYVTYDPKNNIVKKYPHPGNSRTHEREKIVQKTHFDKLIGSFERVMELRIFARVLNEYNNYYAKMHPEDAHKLPYMAVPQSKVDKHAIIHEPLLPEDRRAVKTGEYKKELMNFMPKVIKELFVYFDPFGGGNAYHAGYTEHENPILNKRPQYHMIDGASFRSPSDDMETELKRAEEKHSDRFKPFDRLKTERDILKFKEIISRISAEEFKRTIEEINSIF